MKAPTFPNVAIVGMYFRGADAKAIVGNMLPPLDIEIEREPENPYDSMAIKAIYQGEHIGYIEAAQAMFIAPWIDQGVPYRCTVQELEPRRNNLHPICTLTPADTEEASAEDGAVA